PACGRVPNGLGFLIVRLNLSQRSPPRPQSPRAAWKEAWKPPWNRGSDGVRTGFHALEQGCGEVALSRVGQHREDGASGRRPPRDVEGGGEGASRRDAAEDPLFPS